IDKAARELADYVSVARADPDGRAIRFALSRAVRVNTMEAGEKLFVDLLPPDWRGMPPGLPQDVVAELAKRAQTAYEQAEAERKKRLGDEARPTLTFEVGRHPTFTRFSFAWNVPFEAGFSRDDKNVTITFNRNDAVDLGPVRADLPPHLAEIFTESVDDGMMIELVVSDAANVRAFRDGEAYVVDLSGPPVAVSAEQQAIDAALGDPTPGGSAATDVKSSENRPEPAVAVVSNPAVAAEVGKLDPVETPIPNSPPAPGIARSDSTSKSGLPPPPWAISMDGTAAADGQIPTLAVDGQTPNFVRAEARRVGETIRLVFPFEIDTPTAVFRRGHNLWIVFDTGVPIDLRAIRNDLGDIIVDSEITRTGMSQAIRLTFNEPRLTTLGTEGSAWIVTIGEMILAPSRPLDVERKVEPDGRAFVEVPLAHAGSVHWIDDNIVGDRIVVITALGPPRGFIKPLNFVDFAMLPSAHGIAAVPAVDDIEATLDADVVTISRKEGLTLSDAVFRAADVKRIAGGELVRPGYIDFQTWQQGGLATYNDRLQDLQHAVANAAEGERSAPRLDLSRFYLAHGMAQEALGVLRLAADESTKLGEEMGYRILLVAANVMAGRGDEALHDLGDPALNDSPDAHIWRLLAEADEHNWLDVRRELPAATPVLSSYPLALQTDVHLAAAQASVEINDFADASAHLSEIQPELVSIERAARYRVLMARIADASGRVDESLTLYDEVIRTGPRPEAAEAEFRKLSQLRRDGNLDAEKGIEALEVLTAVWRGDETEMRALRMMTQLYSETGQYRKAFDTMRAALIAMPEADTSRLIQDEMTSVFNDLFLSGKADAMPPLEALGLYYDYRDMTPPGRRGDEIVRRLADRLVAVDLLESAEELLAHQVDKRLKGAARAQVAADLAVIYLMDHKPADALRVIHRTRQARLPPTLERRRRLVEARALGKTDRADVALDLLREYSGADVDQVRTDVLWESEDWQKAGEQIERMYGASWSGDGKIGERQAFDLLRAAIAYSLADDHLGLDRLRTKYAPKMAETGHARAFEVVTSPVVTRGVEFQEVVGEVAGTDTLDAFLDEY
ncbi:MAG: hypothetical protein KDJ16_15595, partial [Hyphomicrobiales bacterium]|nr:hypothetical protein [Hyphomicrobiales bacterium]